jgi:hypothetical protein
LQLLYDVVIKLGGLHDESAPPRPVGIVDKAVVFLRLGEWTGSLAIVVLAAVVNLHSLAIALIIDFVAKLRVGSGGLNPSSETL